MIENTRVVDECLVESKELTRVCGLGLVRAPVKGEMSHALIQRGRNELGASRTSWNARPDDGHDRSSVESKGGLRGIATGKALPTFMGEFDVSVRPSPYNYAVFSRLMKDNPSEGLREHLLDGLSTGFDYGFRGDRNKRVLAKNWGKLQYEHVPAVWAKVMKEVEERTRFGPLDLPITVTKYKWDPDESKFRIVNDYKKNGQNDARGEWDELESVYYQIKHLIMIILLLGVGTIVILWDVQGAYRTLNAKRHNWHLQVSWLLNSRGAKQYFIDLVNPFGRIESQRNWEAVAGSIEWILHELGAVFCRHFVDNFHDFVRPEAGIPDWETAKKRAKWIFALMRALGVPFHEVQIGSSFHTLGWSFDTILMTITVAEKKRDVARRLLRRWTGMAKYHLRELERLTGFLYWISLAFYELSPFLGRLLEIKRGLHAKMRRSGKTREQVFHNFSKGTMSYLKLCRLLLVEWSGVRSLWDWSSSVTTYHIWTDASEWGFGGYCLETRQYFSRAWTEREKSEAWRVAKLSMLHLEARAVVAALHTWGPTLRRHRVQVVSDNEPTVKHGTSGVCKQQDCQQTIRALWLEKMKFQCEVDLVHWSSEDNIAADHLSKQGRAELFLAIPEFSDFSKVPESHPARW